MPANEEASQTACEIADLGQGARRHAYWPWVRKTFRKGPEINRPGTSKTIVKQKVAASFSSTAGAEGKPRTEKNFEASTTRTTGGVVPESGVGLRLAIGGLKGERRRGDRSEKGMTAA